MIGETWEIGTGVGHTSGVDGEAADEDDEELDCDAEVGCDTVAAEGEDDD